MASIVEILVNIKDNASSFFADLADRMSGAEAAGSGLSGVLTEITTILGLGALGGAIAASVEVWAEWQQSVVELNAALSLTGQYSAEASAQIQGMAEYIQNVTSVSKQSVIGVSEMAAAFTKLQPSELADLQKAAVGFQTVFGGGMEHAATLFSRSLEGSGIVLRRYGVSIDAAMTEHERFGAIMERFGPMFQIAVSAADTLTGRFKQMENQFQDLERTVGDVISRIFGLQKGLEGTKSVIENVNDWIKDHGTQIVTYGQRFIAVITALIQTVPALFAVVMDALSPVFAKLGQWVDTVERVGKAAATVVGAFLQGPAALGTIASLQSALAPLDESADKSSEHFKKLKEAIAHVGEAIEHLGDKVPKGLPGGPVGTVTPGAGAEELAPGTPPLDVKGHVQYVADLTDAQKTYDEELRAGTVQYDEYLAKNVALRATIEEEIATLEHRIKTEHLSAAALMATTQLKDKLLATEKRMGMEIPPAVAAVIDAQRNLEEQQKKHLISAAAYAKATAENQKVIAAWRVELEKAIKTLGLTDDQIAKILKAMTGLDSVTHKTALSLGSVFHLIASGMEKGKDAEDNAIKNIQAYGQAFEHDLTKGIAAAMDAHAHFAQAIKRAIGVAAATEAKNAAAHAIFELAAAFAAFAVGDGTGGGQHLKAAATYGIAAAEFGVLGGALGGFSSSGGGGTTGAGHKAKAEANEAAGKLGSGTIIIEGGLLDMSNPQQADAFAKAIKDLTGRDVIVLAG